MIRYYVRRPVGLPVVLALFAAGCAHTWIAGPNAQGDFAQVRAQCSIMARHGGNSISVAGSTRFVAGALIGNEIGNAIRANADFNDCMLASGFLIADGQPPAPIAAIPPAPAAPPAPPAASSSAIPVAPAQLAPQPVAAIQPPPSFRDGVGLVAPASAGGDVTYTWPKTD